MKDARMCLRGPLRKLKPVRGLNLETVLAKSGSGIVLVRGLLR